MQQGSTETPPSSTTRWIGGAWVRAGAVTGLALLCSVLLPVVPILLGMLLVGAVALHGAAPRLRPLVQPLLRVPIARPAKRRARLLLAAGAGVLLVAGGWAGSTVRGHLGTAWEQRADRRAAAEQDAEELLKRARAELAAGNIGRAELALLDAQKIEDVEPETRAEAGDLLGRLQRSGDRRAILEILTQLSEEEFGAFERAEVLPDALDFGERTLNLQAVELALDQLEQARQARALR